MEIEYEKHYGDPIQYDPEFKGAKVERRKTDPKWLIAFIVGFILWIAVGIYGSVQGNLSVYEEAFQDLEHDMVTDDFLEKLEGFRMDLKTAWPTMIFCLGIGVIACLLFIAVMRWVTKFVAWGSIVVFLAVFGIGSIVSTVAFVTISNDVSATEEDRKSLGLLLAVAIVFTIIFVINFLIVLFLIKQINLSIQLMQEANRATNKNMSLMWIPIIQSLIIMLVFVYTMFTSLNLSTIGTPEYKIFNTTKDGPKYCGCKEITYLEYSNCEPLVFNKDCMNSCPNFRCELANIHNGILVNVISLFNLFEFLWIAFFVIAFFEMILGGVFAVWYWTMDKENLPFNTFWDTFHRTVKFHLGTIALGSLVVTIVTIIRIITEYARAKARNSRNALVRLIFSCLSWIFSLIEEFVKMISRRAYIMTAVHGTDFFTSAKDAFYLIMRNILGIVALNEITSVVFFVMEFLICLGTTACFYTFTTSFHPNVKSFIGLAILFFFIMLCIIKLFFSVFKMAVDTIFMCFLEDLERNDGSMDKPYFMSKQLREILQKEN